MKIRRMRGLHADERGAAMVEFALVVPLLLVLLVGIFEVSHAWQNYQVLTDAAREGARRAVIRDGAEKVGTAQAPGTVPAVILDRFARARLRVDGAWNPANYAADCAGWVAPTAAVTQPTIYGCGWGRQTGDEARVVLRSPYPFALLARMANRIGAGVGATTLMTDYVMRNE